MNYKEALLSYLLIINLISFLVMYIDKRKAIQNAYRIREKSLFILALCFGSLGIYLGMFQFRHKTRHYLFLIGIPIVFLINLFCVYYLLTHLS